MVPFSRNMGEAHLTLGAHLLLWVFPLFLAIAAVLAHLHRGKP